MVVFQRLFVVGSGLLIAVKGAEHCYGNAHGHHGWVYVKFGLGVDLKSFNDANQYCVDQFGTKLASILNAEVDADVIGLKHACGFGEGSHWTWIGGKFTDNSCGNLQWEDGSVDSGYRNWAPLEPDSCLTQKCIDIYSNDEWGTRLCNYGHRMAVCQYIETTTKVPTIIPTLKSTSDTNAPTETRFASTDGLILSSTADMFLPSTTESTDSDSSLLPMSTETQNDGSTAVPSELPTEESTETTEDGNDDDDEDDSGGGGNNGELIASIVMLGLALSLLCCAGVFAFRHFYQDSSKSMHNATELRTVTSVSGTHTELPESNNTTEAVECVVVPSNADDDAVKEGVAEVRESSLAVRFGDTPYGAEPMRVSVLAQKLAEQTEDEDTSDSLYDVMPRTDAGGDSPLVGDPAMTGGSDDTPETPEEDTHGAVAREAHGGGKQLGEALADMDAVEAFTSSRTSKGRAPQEVVERQRRALSAMRAAVGKAESGAHVRVASQQVEGGSQLEDVVMKLKLAASTEEQKRKAKMLDMAVESQSEKMQVEFDKLRRMPLARDRLIELLLDKADTLLRVSEADF